MSDEEGVDLSVGGAVRPAPPNSWSSLIWGGGILFTMALGVAVLSLVYLRNRPVDMTAHTNTLAKELEDALASGLIPVQSVRESGAELKTDDHALWTHREIEVALAAGTDLEAAYSIVSRELARRDIVLAPGTSDRASRSLVCSFVGRPYAKVTLNAPALSPVAVAEDPSNAAIGKSDFTPVTRRLRSDLHTLFTGVGLPFGSIRFGDNAPREDETTVWGYFELEVELPDSLSLADAEKLVRTFVADQGFVATAEPQSDPGMAKVSLVYRDRHYATITFSRKMHTAEPDPISTPGVYTLPELRDLPLDVPDDSGMAETPVQYKPGLLKLFDDGTPSPDTTPKVAIVVDDGGYGNGYTDEILAIDAPLTLAILPYTPHAHRTAVLAAERGFEILLHMPMESFSENLAFPGMLKGDMDATTIADLTRKALDEVPGATGVNNHTGSKLTADAAALRPFFEVLKEKNLFFIDSRTTVHSVALETALEAGLPAQGNNLFLDNSSDPAAILAQFEQLASLAQNRGQAIGICHFRPATAKVLADAVAGLRQKGIEIVPVSAMLPKPPPATEPS